VRPDEDFERALLVPSPDQWDRLWAAVDDLEAEVESARSSGRRLRLTSAWEPLSSSTRYDDAVDRIVRCLYDDVHLIVPFKWPEWEQTHRYRGEHALDGAPVADAVRMVTFVLRSDHFTEATLAAALEDGVFVSALRRLRRWYDEERPTR
jgi:hypothetical protein